MAKRTSRTILINVAITVALLAVIEFGSWIVLSIHQGNVESRNEELLKGRAARNSRSQQTSQYSSPDVARDLARAKQAGYRFEPYLVYQPRAFKSKHVNISADGFRLNRADPKYSNPINFKIWMFGSSALYGVTNADSETIPGYLERQLSMNFPGKVFQVRNFGIVGYTSLQDLTHFKYRLLRDKPDLIIVFNGVNDHYNAWFAPTINDAMLATNVMPRRTLKYYAELHRREGLVNWRMVAGDVKSLFSNTLTLIEKGFKFFRLRSANSDVEAWKAEYRKRRDADLKRAKRIVPKMRQLYIDNVSAMVRLARDKGIKIILVHQPLLFGSPKPLVGTEAIENFHPRLSAFAMTDKELAGMKEVPSFRLEQNAYWTMAYFLKSYRTQSGALRALAEKFGVGHLDAQAIVDKAGPVAIFTSAYHFTFRGARLLARHIAREAEAQLGLGNQ